MAPSHSQPRVRSHRPWKLADRELSLGASTLVMAVLDLSPESYPGRPEPEECLTRALELQELGASLIDVTALPPRAGSRRLSADDELPRLVPVLRKIRSRIDATIVVSTYNAATAERVAGLGAAAVRDPSGLAVDAEMAKIVNDSGLGLVIGFGPGAPEHWGRASAAAQSTDVAGKALTSAIHRARRGGIDRRRVAADPGLGLAKRPTENWLLLEALGEFERLGQPLLVSPSRQTFLTESVRAPVQDWRAAEAVAVGLAVRAGAHIVRTYEPETAVAAAAAGDRVQAAFESLLDDEE